MGRPVNTYFCMPAAWTLKRARRKAPQITKAKAANQPKGLRERNAHVYSSHPGAIPKDRRSARESYSTPKALEEPVKRATLPSRQSSPAAKRITRAAWAYLPLCAAIILRKPPTRFADVKRLGRRYLLFFMRLTAPSGRRGLFPLPSPHPRLVPLSLPSLAAASRCVNQSV